MKPIYLDYAATCPCDPRVDRAMGKVAKCANSASSHPLGLEARDHSVESRRAVAAAIGVRAREVVWVSGATEADNLAIKGYALATPDPLIITCATEHKAVLASCEQVEKWGAKVVVLGVDEHGRIDMDELAAHLETGCLVSLMLVNNETGVTHPMWQVAKLCRERGAICHCDATQGLGRVPFRASDIGDMVSLSAHKICGPKGVGALWAREEVVLEPLIVGGKQEEGLRAGTTPVPLCVGFAEAVRIAKREGKEERSKISRLQGRLLAGIGESTTYRVNGWEAPRVSAITSICLPADAEKLVDFVTKRVCVSTGSACSKDGPSHVLGAMGVDPECATLRISLGRWTTQHEVDLAVRVICEGVRECQ